MDVPAKICIAGKAIATLPTKSEVEAVSLRAATLEIETRLVSAAVPSVVSCLNAILECHCVSSIRLHPGNGSGKFGKFSGSAAIATGHKALSKRAFRASQSMPMPINTIS